MAERTTLDDRPGPMPAIHAEGDSVTFRIDVRWADRGAYLILRCDGDGDVWASIEPKR